METNSAEINAEQVSEYALISNDIESYLQFKKEF